MVMKHKLMAKLRIINRLTRAVPVLAILLMICCRLNGQSESLNYLQGQLNQYSQQVMVEKLFVHTDKSFYLAGEIIWFKVYDVDGSSHMPMEVSKLAYVEIVNAEQKPLLQAKIALIHGSGQGSFFLPVSAASGSYTLRAYTNWMKNFSADYFFSKNITIVNVFKKLPAQSSRKQGGYDIQFFPEGGNLVNGLESKVGFRVVDASGKGVNFRGTLVDQNNNTVASFQPLVFGLGHFSFTPVRNASYKAIIKLDSNNVVVGDFPAAYDQGDVMKLENKANGKIEVTVSASERAVNPYVYLLVHARQVIQSAQAAALEDGKAIFQVDRASLADGISVFTVFNGARQPVCERLYFKRPTAADLDANSDQQEYETRRRVKVNIQVHGQDALSRQADLSMSVYRVDSLQPAEDPDMMAYLWLSADLGGTIESPGFYVQDSTSKLEEATDNLMLTQGWRRIRWEDVLQDKKPSFEFVPEYEGHIIQGTIFDKRSGIPLDGMTTYVSVPGYKFQLGTAVSNPKGQFHFDVKNFFGPSEIVVQTDNQKDTNYRIDILNPFSEKYGNRLIPSFNLPDYYAEDLRARSLGVQVQNIYLSDSLQKIPGIQLPDSTTFYGPPDHKYFLDEYTRFVTMEEVVREYVSEVNLRRRRDQFHFALVNGPHHSFFDDDPLVLFDGVPVFNADKIIAFDPLRVKKIEVVNRQYFLGPAAFSGIISFYTYQGDLAGFQLDPNALVLEYDGMQLHREFYSPVYETASQVASRIPDYRDVLYWSANLAPDADGRRQLSFYTSDRPGTYQVVIQGITKGGLVAATSFSFTVAK
jgi:hypothetical protein